MPYLVVLLLLAAPTFTSSQSDSQSARHSNKSSNARQNAHGRKRCLHLLHQNRPKARLTKPNFQYNQTSNEDTDKHFIIGWTSLMHFYGGSRAFTVVLSVVGIRQFLARELPRERGLFSDAPTYSSTERRHSTFLDNGE